MPPAMCSAWGRRPEPGTDAGPRGGARRTNRRGTRRCPGGHPPCPGERVRGDEEGGRGGPLVPVGLLQVAGNPEEERSDPEERIADLPRGDDRPLEQAVAFRDVLGRCRLEAPNVRAQRRDEPGHKAELAQERPDEPLDHEAPPGE
eukprot:9356705-Alexandrium_andersonii.AAC.1